MSESSLYRQVVRGSLKLKGDPLKEVNPDGSKCVETLLSLMKWG